MAIARAHLIDSAVTRWYHCITGCVRRTLLLGEGANDRRLWIDNRLKELAGIFSISVGGFSAMENHLHVLVWLDSDVAAGWSDEEVVRRWGRLFPPCDKSRRPIPVSNEWVEYRLKDAAWLAKIRERLQGLEETRVGQPVLRRSEHLLPVRRRDEKGSNASRTSRGG